MICSQLHTERPVQVQAVLEVAEARQGQGPGPEVRPGGP